MEGVLNSSSLAEHRLASWPSALRRLLCVHRGRQHYPPWTLPAVQTIQVGLASLPPQGKGPSHGCPKEMPTLCSFLTVTHLESGQSQSALLAWYVRSGSTEPRTPSFWSVCSVSLTASVGFPCPLPCEIVIPSPSPVCHPPPAEVCHHQTRTHPPVSCSLSASSNRSPIRTGISFPLFMTSPSTPRAALAYFKH